MLWYLIWPESGLGVYHCVNFWRQKFGSQCKGYQESNIALTRSGIDWKGRQTFDPFFIAYVAQTDTIGFFQMVKVVVVEFSATKKRSQMMHCFLQIPWDRLLRGWLSRDLVHCYWQVSSDYTVCHWGQIHEYFISHVSYARMALINKILINCWLNLWIFFYLSLKN